MRETGRATEGCFPSDPFGGLPVDGVIVADDGHRMLMPFQPVHDADAAAPELDIQQSRQIGPMLIAPAVCRPLPQLSAADSSLSS